jgi:hypothetical protein
MHETPQRSIDATAQRLRSMSLSTFRAVDLQHATTIATELSINEFFHLEPKLSGFLKRSYADIDRQNII